MNGGAGPAVLAEGLVKHYSGREGTVEAVRGVDPRSWRRSCQGRSASGAQPVTSVRP
jgi:hypothetical protein